MNEEIYANVKDGQVVPPDKWKIPQLETDECSKYEATKSDRDNYINRNGHNNQDSPTIGELSLPAQEIIYDSIHSPNDSENVDATSIQANNQESLSVVAQIETLPQSLDIVIPSSDLPLEMEDESDREYVVEEIILQKGIEESSC